jgi:hypothetical protein
MRASLILFLIVLLIFSISIAQPETITVYAGETKTINYTVINSGTQTQTFNIYLTGPTAYFAEKGVLIDVYPKLVELSPNQKATITIYIFASKEAREIPQNLFTLTIASDTQKIEKSLIISVLRKYPVYISSISLSKYSILPLESTKITVTIQNAKNEITPNYRLIFSIYKDGKEVLRKEVLTDFIEANGKLEVSQEFFADKYQEAGTYDVSVRLEDLKGQYIDDAKTKFEVKPIVKLPQDYTQKEVKYSFLSAKITVKIKNEGNVVSDQFYVEERLPIFMKDFIKAYTPYTEEKFEAGIVVYRWLVKPLAPGESVVIEYEISLWQTWLVLVAIILAVFFFFRKGFQPALVKTVNKEEGKIKVYIKLKNKSKSIMKNIEVSEEVPPMLKVESNIGLEFEERKVGKKRYLVWKINELRPDEEAVMGYVASALVEIVSLELPKTQVTYIDEKGRKRTLE